MPTPFFQPGDPRCHRAGRPKGTALEKMRKMAAEVLGEELETPTGRMTRAKKIYLAVSQLAEEGNVKAATFLFVWAYGKPPQAIEIKNSESEPGNPTRFQLVIKTPEALDRVNAGGAIEDDA